MSSKPANSSKPLKGGAPALKRIRLGELIAPGFQQLHRDIREGRHSEYWLMGGRGSTKSSFVSLEIVLGLMRDAARLREGGDVAELPSAVVYRKLANTLRGSVYEQFRWAIRRLGAEPYFKCSGGMVPEIRYLPTGQRILFRGASNVEKSKSIKLTEGWFGYLWFEELTEFPGMDAVRSLRASVLRGGEGARTFYTYNPPASPRDWVNVESLLGAPGRLVHRSSYLDVPPAWLGSDFIAQAEELRATNECAWRQMYLGEVTGSGGAVFDNLELREIPDSELETLDARYCGLDFGFAVDPDAFTRWAYDRRIRALYAVEEFYGAHNGADHLAEEVVRRARELVVRCDSADPRMIAELRRWGVHAVGVRKGPGSVAHGLRWLQSLGSIVIDPRRTPNIAREFSGYEYAPDGRGGFLSEYPDRDNHSIDSARYALEPEIGRRVAVTRSDLY